MTPERSPGSVPRRPYEVFGFHERERLSWRVDGERLQAIIEDEETAVHRVVESSNTYGEFLFVTASRPGDQGRVAMSFFGLGYHEYRERWLTDEWFWYQSSPFPDMMRELVEKDETFEKIRQRLEDIRPDIGGTTQSERGKLFELLADLTDDDGALAELGDLESLGRWHFDLDRQTPPEEPPPTGEYLLDEASREKLPPLYSGEELGLDALAVVRFFTPSSNWSWYISEYDGEDIMFGLVIGHEIELGYVSLNELKSVKGPMGLPIERDLHYEPKTLRELKDEHERERRE